MIATANFRQPTADQLFTAAVEDSYSDDALVPGADPYIAQLVAEHQAQLASKLPQRSGRMTRRPMPIRGRTSQLAVA